MRVHRLLAAAALAIFAGTLLVVDPALAHNELRRATPAKGARLGTVPAQVVLEFAERLDSRYTAIAVTAPGGAPAVAGKPQVAGARATQPLAPSLGTGAYTVSYRVVSVDGHPVQGTFTFTVAAAAPATSARATSTAPSNGAVPAPDVTPTVSGTAPLPSRPGTAGPSMGWAVLAGLVLAGTAGLLWWQRRARPTP